MAMRPLVLTIGLTVLSVVAPTKTLHALIEDDIESASHYRYFEPPHEYDPWSGKISHWQWRAREGARGTGPASVLSDTKNTETPAVSSARSNGEPNEANLRSKYQNFHMEKKRAFARDLAIWVQDQSKVHYVPDGQIDHWATLEETLANAGDDCDGLELLTSNLLHEFGFEDGKVFRSIILNESSQRYHMVTLWFEYPDDPWMIDPTGVVAPGMPKMSEMTDWIPLKIFNQTQEFTVVKR